MSKKMILRLGVLLIAAIGLVAIACGDDDDDGGGGSDTLQEVLDRGTLQCGVKDSQPGFGFLEPDGTFSGNDVEFCRAIAAALFGDSGKVDFVPASAQNRFELLASGEIDVLIRTTTWTSSRDTDLGGQFIMTTFYDGQGMMVRADSGITTIADLEGATICVTTGTTTESNLEDRFAAAGVSYTPLGLENDDQIRTAFVEERCDGWTADKSNLAGQRSTFPDDAGGPESVVILAETLSKEPLGPLVRDGDTEWFDVVQWIVIGMITADELGVTSANVADAAANPASNDIAKLLGVGFDGGDVFPFGEQLGLSDTFMQDVIAQVGNFDEVYERTLAPIGLARAGSLNASWLDGGAIFAPPIK